MTQENFFYKGEFYSDIDEFLEYCGIDVESISETHDDYSFEFIKGKEEKIFALTQEFVVNAIFEQTDKFEDRFPEDSDRVFKQIEDAIKESVDIIKLNDLLPSLYYPTKEKFTVTKQDLIKHFKE